MTGAQPLVDICDLACIRDGRLLFSELQLQLSQGELLSLQGANGAGKSTLLRCIAGLYPDYTGSLSTAPFVYAGHKPGLNGYLTAAENLEFLGDLDRSLAQVSQAQLVAPQVEAIDSALERVGLAGYDDVRCSAMSAGQARRVSLARLLLSRAPLWLLDEPLTALDTAGEALLGELLDAHLAVGGGAICATHQVLPRASDVQLELRAQSAVS